MSSLRFPRLLLAAFFVCVATYLPADEQKAATPRFDPVIQDIEGWKVHVEPSLIDGEHAEVGGQALKMLANHLQRIAILVPDEQLAKLQTVEIWLEHAHPKLHAMQYHPDEKWLVGHGYDRRLAKKVHLPQAKALFSRQQLLKHPAVVLHELAHGFHDQTLGFGDQRIIDCYQQAMEEGIYDSVLLYDGRMVPHYAKTNHKEYFAEATEAYFYRNDFFPFVRSELQRHDPRMHDLLVEIWGSAR